MHPCDVALCRKVRRKRNATLFFIEAAVQSVNLVFYIVPNIYLLKEPCYFFGHVVFWCGWVRWTCWNTVSATAYDERLDFSRCFVVFTSSVLFQHGRVRHRKQREIVKLC